MLNKIVGINAPKDELALKTRIKFFLRLSFNLTKSNINLLIPTWTTILVTNPIDKNKPYQNIIFRNSRNKRKLANRMIAENEIIFFFF